MTTSGSPESADVILQRSRELEAEFRKFGADPEHLAQAQALLQDAARSGEITRGQDRSLLRSILDYWASVLRIATDSIVLPPALARYNSTLVEPDELRVVGREEFLRLVQRGERIQGIRLERANLSNRNFGKVDISDCQFVRCTFDGATFEPESRFIYTSFTNGCSLRDVRASRIRATSAKFEGTQLHGAYFPDSDFSYATLVGARLDRQTNFNRCNFSFASLRDAKGDGVLFAEAMMIAIELEGASLIGCEFQTSYLIRGRLQRGDFSGSNFTNAALQECELEGAKFVGANLKDANLERCRYIERAEFDATGWRSAQLDPLARRYLESRWPSVPAAEEGGEQDSGIVDISARTKKAQ